MQQLIDTYYAWLRDRSAATHGEDGWVKLTLPFTDAHRDYLEIYIKPTNGGYHITDGGETSRDLSTRGCVMDAPRAREAIDAALRGHNITLAHDELRTEATNANLAPRLHAILMAILEITAKL